MCEHRPRRFLVLQVQLTPKGLYPMHNGGATHRPVRDFRLRRPVHFFLSRIRLEIPWFMPGIEQVRDCN